MLSPTEEGVMKDERKAEDKISISDSTLLNILPPQLKNIISQYKVMCGCECYISNRNMHSSLFIWCDFHLKHLKDRSHN